LGGGYYIPSGRLFTIRIGALRRLGKPVFSISFWKNPFRARISQKKIFQRFYRAAPHGIIAVWKNTSSPQSGRIGDRDRKGYIL
jgi:hypothetical protein